MGSFEFGHGDPPPRAITERRENGYWSEPIRKLVDGECDWLALDEPDPAKWNGARSSMVTAARQQGVRLNTYVDSSSRLVAVRSGGVKC